MLGLTLPFALTMALTMALTITITMTLTLTLTPTNPKPLKNLRTGPSQVLLLRLTLPSNLRCLLLWFS